MEFYSPAFDHNTTIPAEYTCQGDDVSPPLVIKNVPPDTESLVLINDDPDAPGVTWDHWLLWNISPKIKEIKEDSAPGVQGRNSWGRNEYGGPCPPSGTHRYFFRLYALDIELPLSEGATKKDLQTAMKGHVLAEEEFFGLYKKT